VIIHAKMFELQITKQFCTELFSPSLVDFFETHHEKMQNYIVYLDEEESFLFFVNLFHVLGYLYYIQKNPQKMRKYSAEFANFIQVHLPFEVVQSYSTPDEDCCQICFDNDGSEILLKLKDNSGYYHLDCFECFFEASRTLGNLARPEQCIKLNLDDVLSFF
jgi:hypothetical protein